MSQLSWQGGQAVVERLLAAIAAFQGLGRETESQVGRLVRALALTSTHNPRQLVAELVARQAGWPMLRPALLATHEKDPSTAEGLASDLVSSEHDIVRASALDAVQWMIDRAADVQALVGLTRKLSQDPAPIVRGASARVLRRGAKRAPLEALDILTQIDWGGHLWLADEILGALDPRFGLDPAQLTDAGIDSLLSRVEQLQTLEGRNYEVFQFIAFASERRPRQAVEALIRRIKAIDEHQDAKGSDRWLPMPYSGHGLSLPGVQHADNHHELVRLIRDATIEATPAMRFWLPVLFRVADPNLTAGRVVLREWVTSGESDKIVAAANLLRGFDHALVFSEHELIAEVLVAANLRGSECLEYHAANSLAWPSVARTRALQANRHRATYTTGLRLSAWPKSTHPTRQSTISIDPCETRRNAAYGWMLPCGMRRMTSEPSSRTACCPTGRPRATERERARSGSAARRHRRVDSCNSTQGPFRRNAYGASRRN